MVMGIRLKLGNGKEWQLTAWEIGGNWNVKIPAGHLDCKVDVRPLEQTSSK